MALPWFFVHHHAPTGRGFPFSWRCPVCDSAEETAVWRPLTAFTPDPHKSAEYYGVLAKASNPYGTRSAAMYSFWDRFQFFKNSLPSLGGAIADGASHLKVVLVLVLVWGRLVDSFSGAWVSP